jgi:hypothetical protein
MNSSAVIPDPTEDASERAGGELSMERYGHGRVGARPRFGMPQDLVIASGADGYEAGALQCADGLLSGDSAGQPAGHAGTRTSNEVTSGVWDIAGAGSSSR